MDCWQNVLPFVQKVYSGIESCPHMVIQLCLLLHAKVKEYAQCHAIASIWLRCQENSCSSGYRDVAKLYITDVMIPQGQKLLIPKFLSVCTCLDSQAASELIAEAERPASPPSALSHVSSPTTLTSTDSKQHTQNQDNEEQLSENATGENWLTLTTRRIGVFMARQCSFISLKTLVKIAAVTVCLYLATVQANKGDMILDLGRASVVWQGGMKLWWSLFGPVRLQR